MIIDCKKLVKKKTKYLKNKIEKQEKELQLDIIYIGQNPASKLYIRKKQEFAGRIGVKVKVHKFKKNVSTETLKATCKHLNFNSNVTGYFFQLPLNSSLMTQNILDNIDPDKDVDCLTSHNLGKVLKGVDHDLKPATVKSILEILKCTRSKYKSRKYTIINDSNLIGKPLAAALLNKGATVTVCNVFTKDLKFHTLNADVVITAVGKKDLVKKDMISEGVRVIDAGIVKHGEKTYGDADTEPISKIAKITPVPGGVGPLTIVSLFTNLLKIHEKQND